MRTQRVDVVDLCKSLSRIVFKRGKFIRNLNGYNSERDGSYSSGYRDEGTVHELKTRNFTVELTKARHSSWNLGADSTRSEERLVITHGKRSQCIANHNLGGVVMRFGAGEMYSGTDEIKPEPWKVGSGRMPVELLTNWLKRNSNKRIPKKRKSARG